MIIEGVLRHIILGVRHHRPLVTGDCHREGGRTDDLLQDVQPHGTMIGREDLLIAVAVAAVELGVVLPGHLFPKPRSSPLVRPLMFPLQLPSREQRHHKNPHRLMIRNRQINRTNVRRFTSRNLQYPLIPYQSLQLTQM
jgi:hypothetical protein